MALFFFFFQAEDVIRGLVRSRGLGDVYKRQVPNRTFEVWIVEPGREETVLASLSASPLVAEATLHTVAMPAQDRLEPNDPRWGHGDDNGATNVKPDAPKP